MYTVHERFIRDITKFLPKGTGVENRRAAVTVTGLRLQSCLQCAITLPVTNKTQTQQTLLYERRTGADISKCLLSSVELPERFVAVGHLILSMSATLFLLMLLIAVATSSTNGFMVSQGAKAGGAIRKQRYCSTRSELKMNFLEDAVRFFSNMKKEASAKHILISGPGATEKLIVIKSELEGVEDLSDAFSVLASKVVFAAALNQFLHRYLEY